ncbi:hypothetical protein HOG98_09190 [bacterium]|jgi:hypothetical protein|nr:hypothetical protein [bacterium]
MNYKIIANRILSDTVEFELATIQSISLNVMKKLTLTGHSIKYVDQDTEKLICKLDLPNRDLKLIASTLVAIDGMKTHPSVINSKLITTDLPGNNLGAYGNQFFYRIAYLRAINNTAHLIDQLKSEELSGSDIAKTAWFYLRIQRRLIAEKMDSKDSFEFSKDRFVEMNSPFPKNLDVSNKAMNQFKVSKTDITIQIETANSSGIIPTSIKLFEDIADNDSLIPIAFHHASFLKNNIDVFKIVEPIIEEELTSSDSVKKLLYFYWLQIHDMPLIRGTSSIAEMLIKAVLDHKKIQHQPLSRDVRLDYEALISSPENFIQMAADFVCPSINVESTSNEVDTNSRLKQYSIPTDILPVVNTFERDQNQIIEKQLVDIQALFGDMLEHLRPTTTSIQYVSPHDLYIRDFEIELGSQDQQFYRNIIDTIVAIERRPIDPNLITSQLQSTESSLFKVGYYGIVHKTDQLIGELKEKQFSSKQIVDISWFYIRVQRHLLATMMGSDKSELVASKRKASIAVPFPLNTPIYKKAGQLIKKQKRNQFEVKIKKDNEDVTLTTIKQITVKRGSDPRTVAIQARPGILRGMDTFQDATKVYDSPEMSNKDVASRLFKFYWLQIHEAPFTRGTSDVADLFVKSTLTHLNIPYIQQSSDLILDYEALILPQHQFTKLAMKGVCPDLHVDGCCTIS